jgi:long-subunit acyl-CoA synthetase (AMP-forming)
MAVGDRRPYNVALIVLDPDAGTAFAAEHAVDDASPAGLASDERVISAVSDAIRAANEQLARVEQIKRFVVLPVDWEVGGDELTPTMKLRRRHIEEKYRTEIEALYGPASDP